MVPHLSLRPLPPENGTGLARLPGPGLVKRAVPCVDWCPGRGGGKRRSAAPPKYNARGFDLADESAWPPSGYSTVGRPSDFTHSDLQPHLRTLGPHPRSGLGCRSTNTACKSTSQWCRTVALIFLRLHAEASECVQNSPVHPRKER